MTLCFILKQNHSILLTLIRFHSFHHSLQFTLTPCHFLLLIVIRCHSFSLLVTRCHSLYHSFSFIVIRCNIRFHSLSLDVSLVCLFITITKLRELFLFIKLFVATMMEISKNNLFKCGIESDTTFTKVSGDVSQYILCSGSLWHSLSKSLPKNKRNVSLEIFKTSVCFLSMIVQLGLANNHIN